MGNDRIDAVFTIYLTKLMPLINVEPGYLALFRQHQRIHIAVVVTASRSLMSHIDAGNA